MRFYQQQHRFYCGVDLHARCMYLCILDANGLPTRASLACGALLPLLFFGPPRHGSAANDDAEKSGGKRHIPNGPTPQICLAQPAFCFVRDNTLCRNHQPRNMPK